MDGAVSVSESRKALACFNSRETAPPSEKIQNAAALESDLMPLDLLIVDDSAAIRTVLLRILRLRVRVCFANRIGGQDAGTPGILSHAHA